MRGIEQILLHSGLKQRKIMLIKCIDGVQSCNIAVVLPAAEPVFIHIFDKNILHEIKLAVCGRILNKVFQQSLFHYVCITAHKRAVRHIRIERKVGDPAVFVNREAQVIVLFRSVELMLLVIHNRYIRTRFNVLSEHFVICCVVESVAPGQNDIFLSTAANIAHYGTNCIDRSPVNAGIIPRYKGRKDKQTVPFAVEIPFLSAAEVIHQRVIISLSDYADV